MTRKNDGWWELEPQQLLIVRLKSTSETLEAWFKRNPRLTTARAQQLIHEDLVRDGEALAETAKKAMQEVLRKGHRFKIGASEAAAENIFVKAGTASTGQVYFRVMEGDKTKANYFIRSGFRGDKRQTHKLPPQRAIRMWLAEKGIRLSNGPDSDTIKIIKSKSKLGKPYARAYKSGDQANEALERLRQYLAYYGSEVNHWNDLYPTGSGRFDYPMYIARRYKLFNPLMRESGKKTLEAFVTWMSTGGKYGTRERKLEIKD